MTDLSQWTSNMTGYPSQPNVQSPQLTFGGAADPVPVGGTGTPLSFGGGKTYSPSDFFGAAGGLFSLGTPVNSQASPSLHPGQQLVPTSQVNGQAGYVSGMERALNSILVFIGAKSDAPQGGGTQAQHASYTTGGQGNPSTLGHLVPLLLLAGGAVLVFEMVKK